MPTNTAKAHGYDSGSNQGEEEHHERRGGVLEREVVEQRSMQRGVGILLVLDDVEGPQERRGHCCGHDPQRHGRHHHRPPLFDECRPDVAHHQPDASHQSILTCPQSGAVGPLSRWSRITRHSPCRGGRSRPPPHGAPRTWPASCPWARGAGRAHTGPPPHPRKPAPCSTAPSGRATRNSAPPIATGRLRTTRGRRGW